MTIEKIANITARKVGKYLKSPEYISEIVSKKKGREITLDYDECIEVFSYSLEVIIGESIKMIIMCLIAYFLGVLDITVSVLIGFCVLRTYAGGFHMKTYSKCFVTTVVLVALASLFSILISNYIYILPIVIIVSFIAIYLYAPVGSEEKPIETEERKIELKRKSIILFSIFTVTSVLLVVLGFDRLGTGIMAGVFTEGFTITPIGMFMLTKLENIF